MCGYMLDFSHGTKFHNFVDRMVSMEEEYTWKSCQEKRNGWVGLDYAKEGINEYRRTARRI